MAVAVTAVAATPFHTPRLQKIAEAAYLTLPETLEPNLNTDTLARYSARPLRVRTNGFGDVSHIGYKLFNDSLIALQPQNQPVFDFVERYLLELDLNIDRDKSREKRMDVDDVKLVKGTLNQLWAVNPETPFLIDEIVRRMFRLTWLVGGKEVVLTFPSDSQLLLGANSVELEDIMGRDVQRMVPISGSDIIADWNNAKTYSSHGMFVVEGEAYISELIRNDIFLVEAEDGTRKLFFDPKTPSKSVSNIMLTGEYAEELPMTMRLNRYGNRSDTLQITIQQFIAYCKAEGCKLYFGIKTINETTLAGTLFAYNEKLAYDHVLSVVFPLSILNGTSQPIVSTAYAYIPLHNVTEKFFNQNINPVNP